MPRGMIPPKQAHGRRCGRFLGLLSVAGEIACSSPVLPTDFASSGAVQGPPR